MRVIARLSISATPHDRGEVERGRGSDPTRRGPKTLGSGGGRLRRKTGSRPGKPFSTS